MKKMIGISLLFLTVSSTACDICNMSVSLSPDDAKNYVSILFRSRNTCKNFTTTVLREMAMESTSRHGGVILLPTTEDQKHEDIFNVYEIQGLYNFNRRFHVTVSVPVISNTRSINNDRQFQLNGIGDPIVMAKYHLFRTNYETKLNHRVSVGSGLKIPLGSYDFEHKGKVVQHDFQAGSGTVDFIFSLDYLMKYKNWGLAMNANYKANTFNSKADYMFGNSINSTLNLFYLKELGDSYSLLPFAGIYGEQAGRDIENKKYESNTGGRILFGTAGTQFFFYQFKVELIYQHAMVNDMNGPLQLNVKNRVQTGVTYLF
ncbi:MAG: transporter [Flavobacteriales bacterium]